MHTSPSAPAEVESSSPQRLPRPDWRYAAAAVAPALAAWMAFSRGGYFVGETAAAAIAATLALLAWSMLTPEPAAGLRPIGAASIIALALLTVWVLVSSTWSHAPARTVYEFDRLVLYLSVFTLGAAIPGATQIMRWLLRVTAVVFTVVCVAALLARLYPDLFSTPVSITEDRLSWPLGYWNGMGLAAGIGLVLLLHLTSDVRERPLTRALSAAAMPAVAATLFLTLSRGGVFAAIVGLGLLMVLGRAPGLVTALPIVGASLAVTILLTASANALTDGYDAASTVTRDAGSRLFLRLLIVAIVTGMARWLATRWDGRLAGVAVRRVGRRGRVIAAAVGLIALIGALAAVDAPRRLGDEWGAFVSSAQVSHSGDSRLLAASANGRIEHWTVAWDAFKRHPIDGIGAGTYVYEWAHDRTLQITVQDGHSLYLETLAELGIVGFLLLVVGLGLPVCSAIARRRDDRVLWSAVTAVAVTWFVRAGIDWDWEMPAVTLPVLALLGTSCAADVPRRAAPTIGRIPRVLCALALLLLALTPIRALTSQRDIDAALAAFRRGDCTTAIDRSLAAQAALGARSDSYELLGYCDVRVGRPDLAVRLFQTAAAKDPRNWEIRYGLALARASAGLDPRPDLRAARTLNPDEPLLVKLSQRLRSDDPDTWRKESASAPVLIPQAGR